MTEALPISVVIPCHNGEPFLERTLDSVLAQTLPAREIIVVDDGSTDGTAAIGRTYAERYPGLVHYVFQKNAGVSESRNAGMRRATCEWVAFLDADDWFMPEKLARQAALIAADPELDLVYTRLTMCPEDAAPFVSDTLPPERLWPSMRTGNSIAPSSVLMRRKLALEAGGFDRRLQGSADWEFFGRLIVQRHIRIAMVDEPVTYYRVSTSSMSRHVDGMLQDDLRSVPTLVSDLSGLSAWCWRHRILAAVYYRAAMNAREAKDPRELHFMGKSALTWPSPFFLLKRFPALFVSLRRAIAS